MQSRTSIQVYRPTLERLIEYGRFGETYDDVLNRLLADVHASKNQRELVGGP